MENIKASGMSEAARRARRAYHREWAKKNPDKVRANAARHWERVAERMAAEAAEQEEK